VIASGTDDGSEVTPALEGLMRRQFLEYASYVIVDRAIPDLRDGLKPVQRRILSTLADMHDGKLHKVANVIGETMKLHPHGDSSIGDALVVLANKDYFIERQGNFGNLITGHPAAAARYIECRLTPLALDTLFNKSLTEYTPSYDGRKQEPVFLPSKLPTVLLLGIDGIAVGMATKILPHNFQELLEAQIALLEKRDVHLVPDFPQGGLIDPSDYEDGLGKVRVRGRLERKGSKKIVIHEVPYGTTTESVIASIEAAAQKGQIKIAGVDDFTTDKAEIHVSLPRGVDAKETIPQLFAYTQCEVSLSSNLTVIDDGHPRTTTVTDVLKAVTKQLKAQIKAELEYELGELEDKRHWLTLEQIFVEERVYKRIEEQVTRDAVRTAVWDGMHEHEPRFVRPMVDDDVSRLLEIRIRRISLYDIEKSRQEVEAIEKTIADVKRRLKSLTRTTIGWIRDILMKHGPGRERRTEISRFDEVVKREVARANIKVTYDPESGFIGSAVKSGTESFSMSRYDRLLVVSDDGSYRVLGPEEKVLIPGKALHCAPFDEEQGETFLVAYRTKDKMAYGKKVKIHKYIRGKAYQLIKDPKGGRIDLLLREPQKGEGLFHDGFGRVHLTFVKKPRQRVSEGEFDLDILELTNAGAKGRRLAPKPVSRIKRIR
jgi:topoisomerase-4 subunit A